MSRGAYSLRKRQRDADKAKKKRDKAERRKRKREEGAGEIELTTAEEAAGVMPSMEEAKADVDSRVAGTETHSASSVPCRLFVGSLSWDTDEQALRAAFEPYGKVADAVVITDRDTGRSRGFGFVTMEDQKAAQKAMNDLHDSELDGRYIVVNVATERGR
ncbi:MAG: RNA recognition motif domain-containing protein [Polyangiales bacterium]